MTQLKRGIHRVYCLLITLRQLAETHERYSITENTKNNLSFFGRKTRSAKSAFKSTIKQMNITTAGNSFLHSSSGADQDLPRSRKNSDPGKFFRGAVQIASFSQISTTNTLTATKSKLKEEISAIYKGLIKTTNKRQSLPNDKLDITSGINTKMILRKSSISEKFASKPAKISLILQSEKHVV